MEQLPERNIPQSAGDYRDGGDLHIVIMTFHAISASLQLTACIVGGIRSGGTIPIAPQGDLPTTGTGLNPPQHVLKRLRKWEFTLIQVSHIPTIKELEPHSYQHLNCLKVYDSRNSEGGPAWLKLTCSFFFSFWKMHWVLNGGFASVLFTLGDFVAALLKSNPFKLPFCIVTKQKFTGHMLFR